MLNVSRCIIQGRGASTVLWFELLFGFNLSRTSLLYNSTLSHIHYYNLRQRKMFKYFLTEKHPNHNIYLKLDVQRELKIIINTADAESAMFSLKRLVPDPLIFPKRIRFLTFT